MSEPTGTQSDAVWLDVLPSLRGFATTLARGTRGAGTAAGRALGGELDDAAEDAGRSAGTRLGAGLNASTGDVERLAERLQAARDKEAAAAGAVRVAELKLEEVRSNANATASQVAAAEERLATAQRRSESTTAGATVAAERHEAAQRRTEDSIRQTGRAADDAGGELQGFGGDATDAAKQVAGFAAGLAAVGGAYETAMSVIEQGALNDKLAAQLGAPADYAADLGGIAGRLYAGAYGESVGEVNDALRGVLQAGLLPEDATDAQIEGITAKVLDLASTFDQDLGGATKAVGQMLKTGLAPDAESALDVITRGFQQGVDLSDDYLDTLNEYGTQFRKLGIDGAAATGLLSQGLKAGARDGDLVADALKEFSIRAIDGSTGAAAAYAAIGLDAQTMIDTIAAGGPAAQAGLGQVLDGLRSIEDPAAQSAAAVGLFGTQAEDLGAALFALDPTTAVDSLGQVEGAAAAMGTTLADNAQTKLTAFQRGAQQAIVDFLGGQAVPALQTFVGWVRSSADVLTTAAAVVGPLALAIAAYNIVLGISTGATAAWVAESTIAQAVTKIWTGTQLFFNAVMAANPLALVVLAIAALVAAVIIAYQHSETFREVVQGAWEGVQRAVGSVVSWFQTTVVPVLSEVWDGISAGARWLFDNVLKPAFEGARAGFSVLVTAVKWYWENVAGPVFQLIGAVVGALWSNILSPVFGWIGDRFGELGRGIKAVWDLVLRPVFEAVGGYVADHLAPIFSTAVDAIGVAWARIKDLAKTPIRFVMETVIQKGIIDNFNKLAGFFGTDEIGFNAWPIPGFATGGAIHGPGTTTSDSILARLSDDEHVWTAREVAAAGGHQAVEQLRSRALGGALPAFATGGAVERSGIPGWDRLKKPGTAASDAVQGAASTVSDLVRDPVGVVRSAVTSLLEGIGSSPAAELVTAVPRKVVDLAAGKLAGFLGTDEEGSDGAIGSAGGGQGSGWQWQIATLRAAFPGLALNSGYRPGAITATGNSSYHSRGRAVDVPPRRDVFDWIRSNYGADTKELIFSPAGGAQLRNGAPHVYSGVTKAMHYDHVHWAYDNGGYLQPGVTSVYNGTGKPEPVFTDAQWGLMAKQAAAQPPPPSFPDTVVIKDVDGHLIGRMRVEIDEALVAVADERTYGG